MDSHGWRSTMDPLRLDQPSNEHLNFVQCFNLVTSHDTSLLVALAQSCGCDPALIRWTSALSSTSYRNKVQPPRVYLSAPHAASPPRESGEEERIVEAPSRAILLYNSLSHITNRCAEAIICTPVSHCLCGEWEVAAGAEDANGWSKSHAALHGMLSEKLVLDVVMGSQMYEALRKIGGRPSVAHVDGSRGRRQRLGRAAPMPG